MAGSTYGSYFRITTWGESHGKGVGVVVDGCPAGLPLCEENIQKYLNRRKPGQNPYSTPRKEDDAVEILSGIFEGHTTGTPISMMVWNKSQRSADYSEIANYYRPGHADMAYDLKYGFRDYRGGGRSSGRETIGRVAAGAIAATILDRLGISLLTYTKSIGPVTADADRFNPSVIFENPLYTPDAKAAEEAERYLQEMKERKVDTLILGCTHYPLLRSMVADIMGPDVVLVNPAYETAMELKRLLRQEQLENQGDSKIAENPYEFFVSDQAEKFRAFADSILPIDITMAKLVPIEEY